MYLDIAICCIVLLITLFGVIKGFCKTLKKSFILTATIAMMLCAPFATALTTSSMGVSIETGITNGLSEVGGDFFTEPLIYDQAEQTYYIQTEAGLVQLNEALKTMPTNPMVKLVTLFSPMFLNGQTNVSIVDVVVPQVTKIILLLIAYLILFIIIKIIFFVVNKLVQKLLDKLTLLKGIDRLLGGVLAFIKGTFFVLIGLVVVSFVAGMDFNGVELLVEQIDTSSIGKWLIDNNFLSQIVESVFRR